MCDICETWPCLHGCPNYEPRVLATCEQCDEPLEDGEEVYLIYENTYCTECAHSWLEDQKTVLTDD